MRVGDGAIQDLPFLLFDGGPARGGMVIRAGVLGIYLCRDGTTLGHVRRYRCRSLGSGGSRRVRAGVFGWLIEKKHIGCEGKGVGGTARECWGGGYPESQRYFLHIEIFGHALDVSIYPTTLNLYMTYTAYLMVEIYIFDKI